MSNNKKIQREVRYLNMSFNLMKEVNNVKVFFNDEHNYCIVVDYKDNVLFEISVDCAQNCGFLELRDEQQ